MPRPRHQDKDIEREFRLMEKSGWTCAKGGRHFKLKCPNLCKCMLTVSSTPGGGHPLLVFTAQRRRQSCWKED